jgi:ketosteroid isomerase-like protein
MATVTPEAALRTVLDALVTADAAALRARATPDVRWLEERTGEWRQGIDGLIESARASAEGTTEFGVEVGDVQTTELGAAAVVSAGLTFSFVYEGARYRIACPATFVFIPDGDGWRLVHQHTLGMPASSEPA